MPLLPPLPVLLTLYWAAATAAFAGLSSHPATAVIVAHGKLAPSPPPRSRYGRGGSGGIGGGGGGGDSSSSGGSSDGKGSDGVCGGRLLLTVARRWRRRCGDAGVAARPAWAAFYATGLVMAAALLAAPPPPPGLPADVAVAAAVRAVGRVVVGGCRAAAVDVAGVGEERMAAAASAAAAAATAAGPLPLPLVLFVVQAARRLAEVTAVSVQTPRRVPPHLLAAGLSFYIAAPLTWWVGGGGEPAGGAPAVVGARWGGRRLVSPAAAAVAVAVFIAASGVQHWAHRVLACLRRGGINRGSGGGGGGVYRYSVPRGGAFEVVACPHYAAEVVLYAALAAAAAAASGPWGVPPGGGGGGGGGADRDTWVGAARAGCVGFVGVNLGITGRQTVRWYRSRGGGMRWALVPGVW
ncbi:hypothetical protein I4F81_004158 [Pyropia yezoensis]|uniref:Uncharacterized protein n=1 Tax=Pyropia yezoensis TaxID=2788 RepID=A0ACC3BV09_PYRYE|nr:hypothetical protein I4F81_004158 [Neopyropia yezoensis]